MNRSPHQEPLIPWKGIASSILPAATSHLDFDDALRSPCETCSTSPCCSYLPLAGFRTVSLTDLDYARYLLNFQKIELGLSSSGDWSVFYRAPCRYLHRSTFACTVHEQPEQPHICRRYNPYQCWYKGALTSKIATDYIRVDRARLQYLFTGISFDGRGKIVESPDWSELIRALENVNDLIEIEGEGSASPHTTSTPSSLPIYKFGQARLQQPCDGCLSYCCKTLMFPAGRPTDISGLDYLQFCLGFPGVRVAISDSQWALLIETRCRHLKEDRCSVFGQPERPIVCRYYDEWRCSFKQQFEQTEASGLLLLELDQYRQVLEQVDFDANGIVLRIPTVSELRHQLNSEQAGAPACAMQETAIA